MRSVVVRRISLGAIGIVILLLASSSPALAWPGEVHTRVIHLGREVCRRRRPQCALPPAVACPPRPHAARGRRRDGRSVSAPVSCRASVTTIQSITMSRRRRLQPPARRSQIHRPPARRSRRHCLRRVGQRLIRPDPVRRRQVTRCRRIRRSPRGRRAAPPRPAPASPSLPARAIRPSPANSTPANGPRVNR